MSIYYCRKCDKQCNNDETPLVTCLCCQEDICLDCVSEEDEDVCKDCADELGLESR